MEEVDTPLGNVSTYTYRMDEDTAIEVLLLPLDITALGTENSYPPPSIGVTDSFSNWVRSGYFFLDGSVVAQVPRNADDLPLDQSGSQVTDIFVTDSHVEVYYPVNREKAAVLRWEYGTDEWTAEYFECSMKDGCVETSSFDEDKRRAWSINPEKIS